MPIGWIRSVDVIEDSNATLAEELAVRWYRPIAAADWPQRLALLNEIHDHLREEIPDFEQFCEVFPLFIAGLIRRISDPVITSADQAHVFANSADPEHRQAAAAWFREQRDRRLR